MDFAKMLLVVNQATVSMEANSSRDQLTIRDDNSSWDNRNIMGVNSR
jgi:hypothetical protein